MVEITILVIEQQGEISGTQSKQLHWKRGDNVSDNQLRVNDIPGARAILKDRFLLTNRHVNALDPGYDLPSFNPAPTIIPKQHVERDFIEGSTSKLTYVPSVIRNSMRTSDVSGASPGWRPRHE